MTTYYERNKEEILERQKKYIENNREKVLKQKREWARKHRTELREKGLLPPTKKQLIEKIDKAIEELETIKQHYEELRKRPFEDSVFISDMLRQSFILSIKSYLELVLEILGDKENE